MKDLPGAPVIPLSIHAAAQAARRGEPAETAVRADEASSSDPEARAWAVLRSVLDPEVPAVSVVDLGIVREVRWTRSSSAADTAGCLDVWLTPTYSGCPATEAIEAAVRRALHEAGCTEVRIHLRRAPAWTTDWITPEGRARLKAYGIAPPQHLIDEHGPGAGAGSTTQVVPIRIVRRADLQPVPCPHCDSADTERLSAFGSTACKSLWRCRACREPFEHFKPI